MRSMLVIGLGRFGTALALRFESLGNEVMVIDCDENAVNKIAPFVTKANIGDCMDESVLDALGVDNFDVCFVCISENFQSSLEITSLLKDKGAKFVVSKADRDIHAKFLKKIGADAVVYPEKDMANRAAMKYTSPNIFDYVDLGEEYAILEIVTPRAWVGKTIKELDIRSSHKTNIIGVKRENKTELLLNPDHIFEKDEHLIVAGHRRDILDLTR